MRIALGVPNDLDTKEPNGFITAFKDLTDALSAHEKTVFAPNGGDVRLEGAREPVELIDQYRNTVALSKDFARKMEAARADAVIAFTGMGLFLQRRHLYYTSNVPYKKVVELVKGEYPENGHFEKLVSYYRFIASREKENYEKAERIIVLSKKIQELIVSEHGIDAKKIKYVPRPIPVFRREERARKAGNAKIIIMPAELRVMKGIRYAIETMKVLKKEMPEAVLIICGRINNYEQGYVKSLLDDAKGKANIFLAGFLDKERYHAYVGMADCAFMPFCFDECPIALTECIGHGLPVVTNEYAGYEKKVIDAFGYCARHKETGDYAEGLGRILSDEGYAKRKAEGAKRIAQTFTFDRYREAVNGVLQEFEKA